VPTRLLQLLVNQQAKHYLACPSLKVVITGGSTVSPLLAQDARKHLCENIIIMYGCSEAGMIAAARSHLIEHRPGAAGFIVPSIKVETIDASGRVLPPGMEGILRFHVPEHQAVRSYMNAAEPDTDSFRDGCFYPGDTGYTTEEGMLVITGRNSEVINMGGNKTSPERIEEILIKHEKIRDVAVFSVMNSYGVEEICAAVVGNGSVSEENLLEICRQQMKTVDFNKIILVDEIPRNDMGKVMREKLRTLVRI
jgi:acyl-coenzyme A synthetase/AMP-(fatty) acid ligase